MFIDLPFYVSAVKMRLKKKERPREVLHCSPMCGLLMDCGSLVPGILGNPPSQ